MRSDLNIQEMNDCLTWNGFIKCGSRLVLDIEDLTPETDYDFLIYEEQTGLHDALKNLGFIYNPFPANYKDEATIGIYSKKIGTVNFQVTVKKNEYRKVIENLWDYLCNNPEEFKTKFWKRNSTREEIKDRINRYYAALM